MYLKSLDLNSSYLIGMGAYGSISAVYKKLEGEEKPVSNGAAKPVEQEDEDDLEPNLGCDACGKWRDVPVAVARSQHIKVCILLVEPSMLWFYERIRR